MGRVSRLFHTVAWREPCDQGYFPKADVVVRTDVWIRPVQQRLLCSELFTVKRSLVDTDC